MAVVALWAAVVSRLSARGYISVSAELTSYFWSFFGGVAGAFLFLSSERDLTMKGLFRLGVCFGFLFIVVLFSLGLGVRVFGYWKLKAIAPAQWTAMSVDLQRLITNATPEGTRVDMYILKEDVPKSFQLLGSARECRGGSAWGDGEVNWAYVRYGNKSRSWGLFLGGSAYVQAKFPGCDAHQVSANAFFFVGSFD